MPREVAYYLLAAEAEAWPLASDAAYHACTTVLGRKALGVLDLQTQELAAALEQRLRPRAGGMSIEVLDQLRDNAWFHARRLGDENPLGVHRMPLARYVVHLAETYLERRGQDVGLRYHQRRERNVPSGEGCDEAERAARWRWLSFFLPPDLMIAALYAANGVEPTTDRVALTTPRLVQVLNDRMVDTHLHLGAARSFSALWAGLVHNIAVPPNPPRFGADRQVPFGDGAAFTSALLAAAIARTLIANFLWRGTGRGFAEYWRAAKGGGAIAARLDWPGGATAAWRVLSDVLSLLVTGAQTAQVATLCKVYRQLLAGSATPASCWLIARDPLATLLPVTAQGASPETRLAMRAIHYLSNAADDDGFAQLFWQYERVRCLTYRYLVQDPSTAGLDWFKRHYDRIDRLTAEQDSALLEALRLESAGVGLGALEVRIAPKPSIGDLRRRFEQMARQIQLFRSEPGSAPPVSLQGLDPACDVVERAAKRTEVGVIVHFIKQKHCSACGHLQADPRHRAYSARYAPWFVSNWANAEAIAGLLERYPKALLLLRGVDVASIELSMPTWPLIPLFQTIDAAAVRASEVLAFQRPSWRVPPLRHTLHAGEDYRRLAEGLRRIHEPVEFGLLRMGDRIGHGFALGEDPVRWARAAHTIVQPREERLDDLLWEIERYGSADWPAQVGRLEFARAEALRLGGIIYAQHEPTVDDLIEARRLRHDATLLKRLGYPFVTADPPSARPQRRSEREEPGRRSRRVLRAYLTDAEAFGRGQEPEIVIVDDAEVAMLQAAQRWLARTLGRLEITIESNPSSNLLIGDLLRTEDHPLFRLQPLPGQACPIGSPVLVSVNDDDPVTFATRISDEFSYLYYALLRDGTASHDALLFLKQLRDNGWRSRFSIPASADETALQEVASLTEIVQESPGLHPNGC